jgi:exodeoxyribonuclease VII large subunit
MTESSPAPDARTPERDIYSVSRLNREVRRLLEQGFSRIWLEGELSNVARPSSGHLYFSLKDAGAQIRGAMFRNRNQALPFTPEDGMQVLVRGKLSLYEPRGDYKLSAEGLFDEQNQRPLPALPERIGVITSPSGAAIRDVLTVLRRRFPAIPVRVYPVPVQGKEAAGEIAATLELAARRRDCDILILTRGGGSLEDLWPFNEEIVARAIHACDIPVISAVGHEIDFTIADFVADQRAATPSAAAELASPDQQEWQQHIGHLATRLQGRIRDTLASNNQAVTWLAKHLQQLHPGQTLRQQAQRLDELERRSLASLQSTISRLQASLQTSQARLQQCSPGRRIGELQLHWRATAQRLGSAMQAAVTTRRQALAVYSRALNAISPLATLERGYAIVSRPGGDILRDASDVKTGEQINARLGRGKLVCTVDKSSGDT